MPSVLSTSNMNQMSVSPKFAFFGTPAVAATTLAHLIENDFIPTLVVTSPDAPRGRGLVLTPSPTKVLALENSIPVMTPSVLDESAIADIKKYTCEYAVVVAYGKIFPDAFFTVFPRGMLNVHYSLLPKYRGATPLETALLRGEKETGVTVQKVVCEVDAGDILAQEAIQIGAGETARTLRPRLIEMGAELLVATLPAFERGEVRAVPQDSSRATRAYKIKKEDGLLDLAGDARENWNKYRAYADSIGTYFMKEGKRVKITDAEFVRQPTDKFRVLRIIPEGKREQDF